MIRNDITTVKKINVDLIKSALKAHPEATKSQISEMTGISVVTCGKILNELASNGEVLEVERVRSRCGRPATTYRFNAGFASVACLFLWTDRGQLELVSEISDLVGQVIYRDRTALDTVDSNTIVQAAGRLLKRDAAIRAIAVGVPGTVHQGRIISSYLLSLNGVCLQSILCEAFPAIQILVENAARAAAYGFSVSEYARPEELVSYFFIPTAVCTGRRAGEILSADTQLPTDPMLGKPLLIDVGLVCEQKLFRGFSGFAGSMGMFLPQDLYSNPSAAVIADLFAILIPTFNPSVIAVTGNSVTLRKLEQIRALCAERIAPEHMPQMLLRPDCRMDYSRGLTQIALQAISCRIELVQKQI